MKRLVFGLLFVALTMLGCAQNYFNIPADNFAEKVKVLGIAPIFIDTDSDILYPQKELLVPLIADLNRKYEPLLARKIKETENFYAVSQATDEPIRLFSSLMARRERRDDAGIQYNKYFWKNDEVGAYIKKNHLDAVMVIVVSGLTQTSKIYSSNLLTSLETNFNYLTITAQILGSDGTVLWEYPNFRGRLLTYYPLINLQYPDFSESEANLSGKTEVRFKSLDGIRRTLEHKKSDWLLRETSEPKIYGKLFDEMISFIKHNGDKQTKVGAAVVATDGKVLPSPESLNTNGTEVKPSQTLSAPALAPVPVPLVEAPAKIAVPKNANDTIDTRFPAPNEIVPAAESSH